MLETEVSFQHLSFGAVVRAMAAASLLNGIPSVVSRRHDFISALTSPIVDMHCVIVHRLTPLAKFQNPRPKTVGPREGQSLTCITSIDLFWLPDLT